MVMLNNLDRFHLVIDVIDRVPGLGATGRRAAPGDGRRARSRARAWTREHGEDLPEVADWSLAGLTGHYVLDRPAISKILKKVLCC